MLLEVPESLLFYLNRSSFDMTNIQRTNDITNYLAIILLLFCVFENSVL